MADSGNLFSMELPMDWDDILSPDPDKENIYTDSISDALVLSLSNFAKVDIEYISSVTGEDYKTVINSLKGSIYQNPETWDECYYKGWETAEEYLSGSLLQKLRIAQNANESYLGLFQNNVDALTKVLPSTVTNNDIYVTLGSPWVPADIIDAFASHILNINPIIGYGYKYTIHDEFTGTWELPNKSFYKRYVASKNTYGTSKTDALTILEATLNMKTVTVTDEVKSSLTKSGKKRVVNEAETMLAVEKQNAMIQEFQQWVWSDADRKERLERIFAENFGFVRRRIYDGSFLKFPTMSKDISLYPYQKNAIARIIFSPNTLLAHDVGAGKTYIMITAGMELKRMKLSQKNLYVVPNNIVGQWETIFKKLYPDANLICVSPKEFSPNKRDAMLRKIRDTDSDAIIMAYSCYEQIPLSKEYYRQALIDERNEIDNAIRKNEQSSSKLKSKRESVQKKLDELYDEPDNYKSIYFDELNISRLYVDEAHNFKNVPIETKANNALGINTAGSKKCRDMLHKVHMIQKHNNGGGVVLATGTPITNSITDAFIMQTYLQSGELAMLDLNSFDSWVGMFAERVTDFEIDVDTSSYRMATRFAKFHNLPELTAILSSIADFHQIDTNVVDIPDFDGYTDILLEKTAAFDEYLKDISKRADEVRSGNVELTEDNMLKITTDGRKAALDLRLVIPDAEFTACSKVEKCAENVFEIYKKTEKEKSTQVIFCDTSTPKEGFNIYDELRNLLVGMGVPSNEVVFIHDADGEAKRTQLFSEVRKGNIRIIIGSTFKLGLGVNIQDKLIALHHIDVPWRPADMTQREGRILRQGNKNSKVYIYRYITEGSFDAYSWQLLETKQRFISELLSGSLTDRSKADVESTVLNYAEVKALAVGNPLIKRRVELSNSIARYSVLQKRAIEDRIRLEQKLTELPSKISYQQSLVERCELDIEAYNRTKREYSKDERIEIRSRLFSALSKNIFSSEESYLMSYQGFEIILPANMTEEKPYIWLKNNGRYYVELGSSDKGDIIRIDKYLDNLSQHRDKLNTTLTELTVRQEDIKAELARSKDYTKEISTATVEIREIDKVLGVEQFE